MWRVPAPLRNLIFRNLKTPEEGAGTSVWCATDPGLASETGNYYARSKPAQTSDLASDRASAEQLWDRSEQWVAPFT
jgi:dehydrogenase/reductase SDR family protein 13